MPEVNTLNGPPNLFSWMQLGVVKAMGPGNININVTNATQKF